MRVVIADDSLLIRTGLRRLLADGGIEVCGEAGDAAALLAAVRSTRPDVVIVDIRMPPSHTTEGLQAAAAISRAPGNTAVLVLSQYVDADYALELLRTGERGRGYLLKDRITQSQELIHALDRLTRGETVIDPELIEPFLRREREPDRLNQLTARERTVLTLMAEGLTDRGIAEQLWLSPKTVETHVRHILRKLGIPESHERNRRVTAVLTHLARTSARSTER